MKILFYWQQTIENILSSKMRSFLAILGILVGTASVVALISGGQLATENALIQFKTLGTDLLTVNIEPKSDSSGGKEATGPKLNLDGVNVIAKASSSIVNAAPTTHVYAPISYQKIDLNASVLGATENLQSIVKIQMAQGRFVSYLDKQSLYCVIGSGVLDRIRSEGIFGDVLGTQVRVGENIFTVIGVMRDWPESSFLDVNINNAIIVPLDASLLLSQYAEIKDIIFRLQEGSDIDQTEKDIEATVDKILPDAKLNFRSSKEVIKSMNLQHRTFTLMLGFIGGISLLVGGIGVMNIMLVSVIERRREIGLRRAVGARKRDIQFMFLIESVGLTVFGGVVGVIVGILASFIIATFAHWQFFILPLPPLVGFGVSVLTGIFFGYYPALQASKLSPIDALRSE